jgi:glycosyltransferase involved in cell wall biosynthesis
MQGDTALIDEASAARRAPSALAPVPAPGSNPPPAARLSLALMTPWDQQCGNAEYAKRLAVGLERFTDVIPFDMRNFIDGERRVSAAETNRYFTDLIGRVNRSPADLVHIQHEFCFFARRIGPSNRRFADVMRRLDKPVVVSLHTWLKSMTRNQRNRPSSQFIEGFAHRLRNRHVSDALHRADAIVLHSKDTHKYFVETFPKLKKRVHVVPIPIERVDSAHVTPSFVKHPRDTWVMIPGFVSRYKGHGHLLGALKNLPETFKLVVAGGVHPKDKSGNDYWMDLIQQADAWGLQSRIIFTGFLGDPAEQGAVLGQADVFVLPYDEVGQSGSAVLADALSYDRPVVTSRARSMFVYRMEKDTAFSSIAVDVGDAQALATTIKQCARKESEFYPETQAHRSAARGRYSLDNTQAAYERVYRAVLSGGRRGA